MEFSPPCDPPLHIFPVPSSPVEFIPLYAMLELK